ncbi:MAG: Uma2 family endonuclease, partial [Microcystis sp.]
MLTSSPPEILSLEEYRNLETIADVKHEYHDGQIIDMTGLSNTHTIILSNLIVL